MFKKLISVFFINLLISVPTYASAVDEKDINFLPSIDLMMKGKVQVALGIITAKKLRNINPDLLALDSMGFTTKPDIRILVAKSAFIVNKPAGFFDHLNTGNESYVSHVMGKQKIEKIQDNSYKVTVAGANPHIFDMKIFFDSDDISTLPNSKVIRAVTQARKLDVISHSASSIILKELSNLDRGTIGSVQISTYIPLKENRTLVLNYTISGIKNMYAKKANLKKGFIDDTLKLQKLINSFQLE